jgi:hypothetical protein
VLVPVPDYTAKCTILVTTGKAKYDATKKAIVSPAPAADRVALFFLLGAESPLKLATNSATQAMGPFEPPIISSSGPLFEDHAEHFVQRHVCRDT